jgi:hypothetical protein
MAFCASTSPREPTSRSGPLNTSPWSPQSSTTGPGSASMTRLPASSCNAGTDTQATRRFTTSARNQAGSSGRDCHSAIPSITRSVIVVIVCFDTSAP